MFDPDSDLSFTNQKESRNYARFYTKWKRNNFLSEKEGTEVGENRDYVMIICPGQPKTEVHREASDLDKKTHPQEWNDYKEGREQRIAGTPIEVLPGLPQGQSDALKAMHIHTIEQMANLSDMAMQKVGMGANELRMRCKAYTDKNSTEVVMLKQQLAEKDSQIAALSARMDAMEKPFERKKPGPKPKLKAVS